MLGRFTPGRGVFTRNAFDSQAVNRQNCGFRSEGFPSGQREQTVNLPAMPSKVRILPPPPTGFRRMLLTNFGWWLKGVGCWDTNSQGTGLQGAGVAQW